MSDYALLESLRQFIAARFVLLPHRSKNIGRSPDACASSLAFSRGVIKKHELLSVTGTLAFLNSLHGYVHMTGELPGFGAGMIYKEPGRALHRSFYTWFVESVLSLTVRKLEQHFGIWLNRVYAIQTHSNPVRQSYLEHHSYLAVRPRGSVMWRELFLSRAAPNIGASPEPGAVSRMVERSLREVYTTEASQSYTQVFQLPSSQTNQLSIRAYLINTLRAFESRVKAGSKSSVDIHAISSPAPAATRAGEVRREFGTPVLSSAAFPARIFVASQQDGRGEDSASTQPPFTTWEKYRRGVTEDGLAGSRERTTLPLSARGMTEKIKEVYVAGSLIGFAAASRKSRADGVVGGGMANGAVSSSVAGFVSPSQGMPSDVAAQPPASIHQVRLTRIGMSEAARRWQGDGGAFERRTVKLSESLEWFEQKREAVLSFARVEPARVVPIGWVLLKAGRSGELTYVKEIASAPLLSRVSTATTMLSTGTAADKPVTVGRRDSGISEFSFLRREEQMRPPPQSYAFAQPSRPAMVEERVVSHVREKEVEEVVRKEVATVMKSRSPVDALSRADYSRIADHVYTSLARRLLMEKERSGLRS